MHNLIEKLQSHRDVINKVASIFLIVYFCFICSPYIFARVPALNSLFSNSMVGYALRLLNLILYSGFGFVLMIANRKKPLWWLLIASGIAFLIYAFVNLVGPDSVTYYSFYFTGKVAWRTATVGLLSKLMYIGRFAGDLAFLFFLINAYPYCVRKKEQITNVVLPVVVIATIGVLYTLIAERSQLSAVMSGGSPEILRSIFHSKNAYGIFLFNGAVVTVFAFFVDHRRWAKFLILLSPVYLLFSLIINCKLACVCILVLDVSAYVFAIIHFFKRKIWVSFILLGIVVVLSLALILMFSVPALHSSGFLESIYKLADRSISNFDFKSFFGRTSEWGYIPRFVQGTFVVFGFPFGGGSQVMISYSSTNGPTAASLYDLHNAYIDFYVFHGVLGLIFLGLLYFFAIKCVAGCFKTNKTIGVLLLVTIFVSVLFGMAETYTLFVSMSANTFALSFIILATALFLQNEGKEDNHAQA